MAELSQEERAELERLAGTLNDEAAQHRQNAATLVGGQRQREIAEADHKDGCALTILRLLASARVDALSSEPIQAGWREKVAAYLYERDCARGEVEPWEIAQVEAFESADAILSQLPSGGGAPEGWRPIGEQAKGGLRVLLLDGDQAYAGRWNEDGKHWEVFGGQPAVYPVAPTHWMPLPPAPDQQEVDGGGRG